MLLDDHGDNYSSATTMQPDGTFEDGWIESPGDEDWFKFTASAGSRYIIETGVLGTGSDTVIELYGPNNGTTLIGIDDDGGNEDLASLIDWTAIIPGTYYVRVRHYGSAGIGNYKIRIQALADDHSDSSSWATSLLTNGTGVSGQIGIADDQDWFSFSATAGHIYTIETSGLDQNSDTIMYLLDPSVTTILEFDDDGGDGLASRITWAAGSSGTYFVDVRHYDPIGTGAYNIAVQDITSQISCTNISANGSVSGSLTQSAAKLYCISLSQGDQIDVTLDGPGSGADFDLYLKMGYPPGLEDYDARGVTTSAHEFMEFTASGAGTLYIWVTSYSGSGSFTLSNTVTPYSSPACNSLTAGTPANGSLSNAGDDELYCINVGTGDDILVSLDGPNSGADFDLYLKHGGPPTLTDYDARAYSSIADEVAALEQLGSGTVYIRVLSYSGQGSFSIKVQVAGNQAATGMISKQSSGPSQTMNVKGQIRDKTNGQGLLPSTFCLTIKALGKYCYGGDSSEIAFIPGGYFYLVTPRMVNPITVSLSDIPCYKRMERDFTEEGIGSILFEAELDETSDCDNDGMMAFWEKRYGLDIWKNDALLDLDQDGYSNIDEYYSNTSPNSKDSVPVDSKFPVVTGLTNDPGPVANKTWNWDADEPATFRYSIDTNSNGIPTGDYSDVKTATLGSGEGPYYIHVQAQDVDGNESAIVTVSVILRRAALSGAILLLLD